MVEKVNWNPFTNQSLTAEQITELDTNKDGVVSDLELTAKWSWLSEQSCDLESGLTQTPTMNVTAETQESFLEQASIMFDIYAENYFANNLSLTENDRTKLLTIMTTKFNEFIANYLEENPNGPYDMSVIFEKFNTEMNTIIKAHQDALMAVNNTINSYTNNLDDNKSTLLSTAYTASSNNYISEVEWNKVKNSTVNYIMGMLLSGEVNNDFLLQLNSKYSSNSDYKEALKLINELKNCNDPTRMQSLLSESQSKIISFVNNIGKERTVDSLNEYALSEGEKAVENMLNNYINSYLEAIITPEMSDEDRTAIKEFVNNCRDKYLAKIVENRTFETITEEQLINEFTEYITTQGTKLYDSKVELYNKTSEIDKSFENLVNVADTATQNGNISNQEREDIIHASKEFILTQLLSGMQNIELLERLGASNAISQMTSLVSQIWAEKDPDKLVELQNKLNDIITQTLNNYPDEDIIQAIDSLKPVEINQTTKDKAIFNSTISSEYVAGASRSTSRGKQNEDRLKEIQEMAKADLNAYAEALKAQLKAELGTAYDESEIQKYIDDAITDTISLFTQNVVRKNQHGDYTTGTDHKAFVFARRSGTSKGRYVYNVMALIDTFVQFFNETSKTKNAAKIDNSKATYDKENVVTAALGNDYDRNKSEKIYGHKSDENTYAKVIENAKADLKLVAEQIKTSLLAEGVPIDMSKVDEWLDELIMETLKDMKNAFQYCQPSGSVTGGNISSTIVGAGGVGYLATGGTAALASAGLSIGAAIGGTSSAAIGALGAGTSSMLASGAYSGLTVVTSAGSVTTSGYATAMATSSAVPIVGWCIAGAALVTGILGMTTNIFGASYGRHNADAGFYFERKSHSKSGNWGYDTATLVNVFLSKVDAKIAEEKEAYKNKNNPEI